MTLPSAPNPITLSQVNVELGLPATSTITMNDPNVRSLFGKPGSGTAISMSDGYGKSWIVNFNVDYVVIGGGGAGGSALQPATLTYTGGGGAGGYRSGTLTLSTRTNYPVVIGAGGALSPIAASKAGSNGSPSTFHTITANGGGGGGYYPSFGGFPGGSGGGGGAPAGIGGTAVTGQGFPGGGSNATSAGGGGGAGAAGTLGAVTPQGGNGATNFLPGSPVTLAGGGGSGYPGTTARVGGTGGGGNGGFGGPTSPLANRTGNNATIRTGSGGGGGGFNGPSGAGASGVVILKFPSARTIVNNLGGGGSMGNDVMNANITVVRVYNGGVPSGSLSWT